MFFFQSSKVMVRFFILFACTVSFCTLGSCNRCTVGAFFFHFVEPQLQQHFQLDCSSHAGGQLSICSLLSREELLKFTAMFQMEAG